MAQQALIVDDSKAIRSILARMLGKHGFANVQAGDGTDALTLLRSGPYELSLVCVDYNMPEMNGIDFLLQMRTMPGLESVPVMMITTETHMELMERAFAAGVNEYLMKPFSEAMVREKLEILDLVQPEPA
jgi:two-component system chemotaxis response regulator CheY